MDLLDFIPVIGIIQGGFLCIILFSLKNGIKEANIILGLLIISFSLSITRSILPECNKYFVLLILLFGPLFLQYVLLLTNPEYKLKIKVLFHFIPFVIALLLQFIHTIVNNDLFYLYVIQPMYFIKNFHTIIYCFYIIHYIEKHRKALKNNYSNIDRINLAWLMILLYLFIIYFYIISPSLLIFLYFGIDWVLEVEAEWTPVLVSVYIFFIGFNGIRYHQVFIKREIPEKAKKVDINETSFESLTEFMKEKKPYLSDDLTLLKLSEITDIPEYYLSRMINQKLNKNFFDYINSYRVNYFNEICLLDKNKNKSILDMALESGFYSKSTFNLNYKKIMKMTPSQFKKKNKLATK